MMGCGQCGGVCDACRQADLQLRQAMSSRVLTEEEIGTAIGGWWTKYLVETDNVQIGYDLTSWALPIKIGFGTKSIYAQLLCFDFNLWWGEYL